MRICICEKWKKNSHLIDVNNPKVKFCPWCGTELLTTKELREKVQEEKDAPSQYERNYDVDGCSSRSHGG